MLHFENLKVWTQEERSWFRKKVRKSSTVILQNVSGQIHQEEFIALLGPSEPSFFLVLSGAGKTTLLSVLAGRCRLPQSGIVTLGNRRMSLPTPRFSHPLGSGMLESVTLVPQKDTFMESITVAEHLQFMTEMKLGTCKRPAIKARMQALLNELMLEKHKDTVIRGLSGGERRLLSLAGELLSNPRVLLCDEPTSGLDSYNSLLVVQGLQQLARTGVTVLCSIHQPSSGLFRLFSSVMLMTDGRLLFHGTHDECREVFDRARLPCPVKYNPAEFYIKNISTNIIPVDRINEIENHYKEIKSGKGRKIDENVIATHAVDVKVIQRNWLIQVYLLVWRYILTVKQDASAFLRELLISMVISACIVSACYVGLTGTNQRGIQDATGFLWLLISEVCFGMGYCTLYSFDSDLELFKREAGIYSCSAFYVARFICFIPRCVLWSCAYAFIATSTVVLPDHAITTLEIIVALIAASAASTAYGLGVGALFLSSGFVSDVMPSIDLPLILVSGTFLKLKTLPTWLTAVKYLSHFYFSADAVNNIFWRKISYIECDIPVSDQCITSGQVVLASSGYSSNFQLNDGLGLLGVTLFWSILGYLGLKREQRKGYAY